MSRGKVEDQGLFRNRRRFKRSASPESCSQLHKGVFIVSITPGGVLAEKLGRGVRPASQNPYPIYDQNLRFSLPYL